MRPFDFLVFLAAAILSLHSYACCWLIYLPTQHPSCSHAVHITVDGAWTLCLPGLSWNTIM